MFEHERIAVIGVSSEGFSFGRAILMSLINIGFNGTLYPVNPKGGTIAGLSIYRDVRDIPGSIDLGIITIPAPAVPSPSILFRFANTTAFPSSAVAAPLG